MIQKSMKPKSNMISFRVKKVFVLLVDIIFMILSLFLATGLRNLQFPKLEKLAELTFNFIPVFAIFIVLIYSVGFYTIYDKRTLFNKIPKIIVVFVLASLISVGVFYIIPDKDITPKTVLFLFSGIYFFLFIIWRINTSFLYKKGTKILRIGIIGNNPLIKEFIEESQRLKLMGYEINLLFDKKLSQAENQLKIINDYDEIENEIKNRNLDLVVISNSLEHDERIQKILFRNISPYVIYMSLPDFYESIFARIPIGSINQLWFLEHLRLNDKIAYDRIKRFMDFIFSFIGLIITLPIWPLVWFLVKATSKGPGLFSQTRTGYSGRNFTIFKFRTMTISNNDYTMTIQGDLRITAIGKFLRKSRFDELPQLWNILKGDMSFVGPRPERPELIEELEKEVPFYKQRLLVVPGLTGWDQVSGEYHSASVEDTLKKLQYDLFYVKNRSLYLDFTIVLKTIGTVLGRSGR